MKLVYFLKNNRFLENIHIFFWLIKDSCWMMNWKYMGMFMILPTVLVALWMIKRTWNDLEKWINLSVLLWVMANSWWMITEFYGIDVKMKYYSSIPFALGFLFFFVYVWKFKSKSGV
jgi:hypothetical protein